MTNNTKYDKLRPVAIALRMRYPEWTSRDILAELAGMGYDPIPAETTLGTWCRKAGAPLPYRGARRPITDETRQRILRLKIGGMTTADVQATLKREGAYVPSSFFINRLYRDWRDENGVIVETGTPEGVVIQMIHAGLIELGEAWDELTRRGVDDQKALAWVMNRFTGPSAPCEFASSECRTFSLHERRWAA